MLKNWLNKHYEYDQRGNLLAKSENGKQEIFRWNGYNRLIQYTKDNQTTEYKYDPFGRRIAKIHNGTTTLYHWDGDVLAAESNANSTTHYIFEPDTFEPVAQFVSAPLRPQTPLTFRDYTYYTPEIDPLNQEPTPQEYLPDSLAYFHLDHLGTPIEMTDRTGKTVWEASYKAWGEVETVSGSMNQPFRFQGQYFDEESGLHYNRFRYYDPSSGRFVSQDPIRLLGGFNLYGYAPNPIGWIDVLGLSCFPKGFKSYGQFKQFGQAAQAGLKKAGFANASMYMQGSSHSGRSFETGRPFDEGRISDFDIAVAQPQLFEKAVKLGLAKGDRSQPIKIGSNMAKSLGINDTLLKLSKMSGGRDVNMMIFKDVKSIKDKASGTRIPAKCMYM